MKLDAIKKVKTWLIIASLVIALVGMIMLGVLGFNKTPDYSNSYEVSVSVDQNLDGSFEKAENLAKDYLDGYSGYAIESVDGGSLIIFKFNNKADVEKINKTEFIQNLKDKINNTNVNVDVSIDEVVTTNNLQIAYFAGALAIVAVAAFIYLWIMEKMASAISAVSSAVITILLTVAMFAITRVPVYPMLGVGIAISVALSLVLSAGLANRFKEERKKAANENASFKVMANAAIKASLVRFGFIAIAIAVVSILLMVLGLGYLSFFGVMILIADVCAVLSTYTFMPLIWASLAKKKK